MAHGAINTGAIRADDAIVRLNTICPYFTMFPLSFPLARLSSARASQWILDPFCGRGTTNFAARLLGFCSVGIDANPVAIAIAEAKLVDASSSRTIGLAKKILGSRSDPSHVPVGEFWSRCFHPSTLKNICKLREHLREARNPTSKMLRALLLGILHGPRNQGVPTYLSNQMPRTYATKPSAAVSFWKRKNLTPQYVDVLETLARRAEYSLATRLPAVDAKIISGDSQTCNMSPQQQKFDQVITSPPYVGMRTYKPDQWLRNWFLGGPASVDYTADTKIGGSGEATFAAELAKVWQNVARSCTPGARMTVRFGALPSEPCDPAAVLKTSLFLAQCGWRIITIKHAGNVSHGRRQAEQFARGLGKARNEIDLYAIFEG